MFTVYHSNQLDMLKTLAAWHIEHEPLANPFQPEVVLVQSPGMAQWLQMALAQQFGIAANIEFPLPASFIWKMFVQVLPDIPEESAFNKSGMSWKLMALLPEMLTRQEFITLRHYLNDDEDQRKRFQLASRVADLFDQYLVYRASWLNSWEKGQQIAGLGDAQHWQAPLWAELVAYTQQIGQPGWHRANLYTRFIQALNDAPQRPAGLPDRVFICGISALPPVYLHALQALSKHIDIHLLFTNPCRHYWGDIQDYAHLAQLQHRRRYHPQRTQESALFRDPATASSLFSDTGEQDLTNPLLASWGKLGRDNLSLLAQMDAQDIDAFVAIPPDNLLHTLQHDLLELEDKAVTGLTADELATSQTKRIVDPGDHSLRIHVCHSPQREVEVLQDSLLAMMADYPELMARDIIVMVADIDAYTPFIQAVFGHAPDDRYVPFSISDRRASYAHPALIAFVSLLSLPASRFASEEVLSLLEVPAVAARFAIDEAGLRRLRLWVEETGIRWGLDDDTVRELALPVTGQHTWRFGITRMLLGYAMESASGDWAGVLPYDESSGLIAELAGNLAELLMRLNHWRQTLAQPRTLEAWQPLCRELLADFFTADTDTEAVLALIEEQWQQAIIHGVQAHYQQSVPVTILHDELATRLDQQRISQRFLAGAVNFCTLMPMRSIPFKVVCLLGMNDGVYPRTLPPLGFDLMSQHPQKGDRSRRDDDRYLFLEALISAQQQLYISYIGRSIQDNTPRNPSVLLSELVDYIAQSCCLPGDETLDVDHSAENVRRHLHHWHSRMPFDAENFRAQNADRSFAAEWLPAASAIGQPHPSFIQTLAPVAQQAISVEQLLRFWRHPVRAFFTQRLGVTFTLEDTELSDSEPFTLDALERYQMSTQLLNALVEGDDSQQLFHCYRAAGALPYGVFGELAWQAQQQEMALLAQQVRVRRNERESWEISLQIADVHLSGWLADVQADGLLRWRAGELNFNDGLALWLEHLMYCAMGGVGHSQMLGRKESQWCFNALDRDEAYGWLRRFVAGYQQGMCTPLLLLVKSGGAWLTESYDESTDQVLRDEHTQHRAREKLLAAWQGSYQQEGEGSDPYLQRLLRTLDESHINNICAVAETWLLPLLRSNCPQPQDK